MWHWTGTGGLAVLVLAGCMAQGPSVTAPAGAPAFDAALVLTEPKPAEGLCWHSDQRPALFETVTEQIRVSEEVRDTDGTLVRPASFRSETRQSEIRPRQTVWFRIPCPQDGLENPAFVASLQRALKARGLYGGAVTGTMDTATETAVRRYQAANGLDSAVISLAAGQALGLVSVVR